MLNAAHALLMGPEFLRQSLNSHVALEKCRYDRRKEWSVYQLHTLRQIHGIMAKSQLV